MGFLCFWLFSTPTGPISGSVLFLDVLKIIFTFCLGPPLPRGVPGEGPDCHFPKEIVGFGPIPARILGFLIFILALSTARSCGCVSVDRNHLASAIHGYTRVLGKPGSLVYRGAARG